jgi:hypothetical protein
MYVLCVSGSAFLCCSAPRISAVALQPRIHALHWKRRGKLAYDLFTIANHLHDMVGRLRGRERESMRTRMHMRVDVFFLHVLVCII